jgi:hypothetical protein
MNKICLPILALTLVGCATPQEALYNPPNSVTDFSNSIVINKPFDDVWSSLIRYTTSEFFGIDNFEKDSGLITLSFSAKDIDKFITGGNFQVVEAGHIVFDGDYSTWVAQCCNPTLIGRINLLVSNLENQSTRLTVNARYVLTGTFSTPASRIGSMPPDIRTWSFNTNGSDTQKIYSGSRTFSPNHNLEKGILNSVEEL